MYLKYNMPKGFQGFQKGHKIRLGIKHTSGARKKMRKNHPKGIIPKTAFKKGFTPWNKDKKGCYSEETIKEMKKSRLGHKLSESGKQKLRILYQGEKCRFWKGGITPLNTRIRQCFEYRQWRSDVFTRDNFTCQKCGVRGGKLEADHYPKMFSDILREYQVKTMEQALNCEELWNINNGRTLCLKCHYPKRYK